MKFFPCINRDLILLKALLIAYYGAMGSLWPFLTLHMMQLGLSLEETAVINLILPFLAAACKPFIGVLADKTGKYRLLLGILLIITSGAYTSLLAVPSVEYLSESRTVHFHCTSKGPNFFVNSSFGDNIGEEQQHTVKFKECSDSCNDPTNSFPQSTSWVSFHRENVSARIVQNIFGLTFNASVSSCDVLDSGCLLNTTGFRYNDIDYDDMKCNSINYCEPLQCKAIFTRKDFKHHKEGSTSFWLYLVLRAVAEMLLSACYPLTDIINLSLCSKFDGQFGRQQLFGIFAFGLAALISGSVVDYSNALTGKPMYSMCFYLFDFIILCTVIILAFIKVEIKVQPKSTSMSRSVLKLLKNPAVLVLFAAALLMGVIWGFMETFLYWYLLQLGATRMLIGLAQLVSVLPAIPMLYKSNWVIRKVGHVNILIFAFFVYCARSVGYVYIHNPWWSLLLESTKVFSMYLARLSFTIYADFLAPPELKVTTQSIVFLLHFDVGRGVGSLVGGFLMEIVGNRATFQIVAIYSGVLACTYFALHHFYFKSRLASPNTQKHKRLPAPPPQLSSKDNKGDANGAIQKHEEPLLTPNGIGKNDLPRNGHFFIAKYKDLKHTMV